MNEGSPKWYELLPNQDMLNTITARAPRGTATTRTATC